MGQKSKDISGKKGYISGKITRIYQRQNNKDISEKKRIYQWQNNKDISKTK